jgi:hypothetical protein
MRWPALRVLKGRTSAVHGAQAHNRACHVTGVSRQVLKEGTK